MLALPCPCALCRGWSRQRLCGDCRALAAAASAVPRCPACALRLPTGVARCADCLRKPPPFAHAVAAVDYALPWDGLLARMKFNAAPDLAPALAGLLAHAVRAAGHAVPTLLLPVPLAPRRLAQRGYNQSWLIARHLGRSLNLRSSAVLLRRWIDGDPQAGLTRKQRAANLRGCFGVDAHRAGALRGARVALVDDVLTTGSTAAECTRALMAAGASSVCVWVVARTP